MVNQKIFNKSPTTLPRLHAEEQRLRDFHTECLDRHIIKQAAKVREARIKRSEVAAAYTATCQAWIAEHGNKAPSPSMLAVEASLQKQADAIAVMRAELKAARLAWAPSYFARVQPHLDSAIPVLVEAAELIEAVARFYAVHDAFVDANGVGDWKPPRAPKLEAAAKLFRRLSGDK